MTNNQSAYALGFPEVLNLNLWFIVLKPSPNHFFLIPLANHRHWTNLNFDRYADDGQQGDVVHYVCYML